MNKNCRRIWLTAVGLALMACAEEPTGETVIIATFDARVPPNDGGLNQT